MMIKNIYTRSSIYLFGLLMLLVMSACEKKIDFDIDDVEPYVVLLSRPVSDSTVAVYLSYSRFFLDSRDIETIPDATVKIYVGGQTFVGVYDPQCINSEMCEYGECNTQFYGGYAFVLRPHTGDTLYVEATVPGRSEKVTSSTVVPQTPEVEILEYSADLSNEKYEYGSCNYKLKIRLHCGSNKEYYSVRLYGAELMMENDNVAYWDTTSYRSKYFSVNDPIVNSTLNIEDAIDGDDGSFGGYEMTFGTDKFIGGEHEFTIEFSYNGYISNGVSLMDMPVILQVSAISEDLYLYDRTADGYDSDMDDLFSEPVQVHCNIVGGIGIFGASTIAKYRLQSPKPIKKLKSINRK